MEETFFSSTLQHSLTPVDLYGQSHKTLTWLSEA